MDQNTMGKLLAKLRKEKGMTQEQLAEKLGVTNRSVSRWENGRTLPDLSLMFALCREYDIGLEELICGARDPEIPRSGDKVRLVAKVLQQDNRIKTAAVNGCILYALLCFAISWILLTMIDRALYGWILFLLLMVLGSGFLVRALWLNHARGSLGEGQIRMLLSSDPEVKLRTEADMLCFVMKHQRAERKQYKLACGKIAASLEPGEYGCHCAVFDAYSVNNGPEKWHGALLLTQHRLLLAGESLKGRYLTVYPLDTFARQEITSVTEHRRGLRIRVGKYTVELRGKDLEPFAYR